ncbi:MAG TPA: ROK family protein [Candidatus Binataceae bacterium]
MSKARYVIGLDMGGTNLRCGAVSTKGEILILCRASAHAMSAADSIAENIAYQVRKVESMAHGRGWGRAAGVGVAVPGPINLKTGVVLASPHVVNWRDYPLRQRLQALLKRPIRLENDANAWALGEFWLGAARGFKDVILLTLGTGVGGGVIVGGKVIYGRAGMAGELGHITVEANGPPCDCGARGCLEAYASASGLRQMVRSELGVAGAASERDFLDQRGDFSVRKLAAAAKTGNQRALRALESAGRHLGIAIASLINIFDPELVVIGGGIAGALSQIRATVEKEVRLRSITARAGLAPIIRAALGDRAGVIGAARAAM